MVVVVVVIVVGGMRCDAQRRVRTHFNSRRITCLLLYVKKPTNFFNTCPRGARREHEKGGRRASHEFSSFILGEKNKTRWLMGYCRQALSPVQRTQLQFVAR